MCGSVRQLNSCVPASEPHWTWGSSATHLHSSNWSLVFVGFSGCPSSSLAQPAMAPALTQATHQRQTLSLHPAASPTSLSSKLDTLTSPRVVCADESTQHLKQLVWSSHCCGVDVGISKGRRSKKEIARSEEVSRSEGQATGTALDPPATKSQAPASTTTKTTTQGSPVVAAAAPERSAVATVQSSSVCSEGSSSLDVPVTRCVNGKKTMGLQPIAVSGDRMSADLSSPVPTVIKSSLRSTEWPMSSDKQVPDVPFGPDQQDPSLCLLEGSDPLEADVDDTNVQDILDVINSMEGDTSVQCGSTAAAAVVDGLDCALNKLTAEEQLLLRQAAAVVLEDSTAVVSKETTVEQKLDEVRCKQQQIEQRCQSLLRRAGRLQSRQVSRHVADQVSNFVQYAKDTLGVKQRDGRTGPNGSNLYGWAEDGRLPTREEVRNIPTATLVNLVSRLQAPPISYLSNRRYFALGTSSSSPGIAATQCQRNSGTRLSTEVSETLEEVAGQWESQLRYLQRYDDPDATESSSGGESDDDNPVIESQQPPTPSSSSLSLLNIDQSDPSTTPLSNPLHSATTTTPAAGISGTSHSSAANQQPSVKPVSTYQRAAWRWARDRAAIAARWSWLQAQVADLEYRIRQHTDVYRQLRAAKGALHFGTSGLAITGTSPAKESISCDVDAEAECSVSRSRPMTCNGTFRKRRLVRTSLLTAPNAPAGSRKIPRHSTVRCCCVLSRIYNPCVLCGGKNNYLLPVDPDGMTIKERIGLIDRGFHPVLSLPQDIPLSAHVDSLLKSGDWRTPTSSQVTSGTNTTTGRRGVKTGGMDDEATPVTKKRTFKRKHSKSSVHDEFSEQTAGSSKLDRRKTLKRRKRTATSGDVASVNEMDDSGSGFPPSSPACLSASGDNSTPGRPARERSMFHDLMRRRTSYDIDNIVIPYSMAATTRVERLQYKEILTPKWRTVEDSIDDFGTTTSQVERLQKDEDTEDVSEDACVARHERSEVEERRKFMSYLKQPSGSARGRSRRVDHILDSRAESSGANTPDQPMSPHDESSVTPVKFVSSVSTDNLSGTIKQERMDSLDVVGEDEAMSTTCDTPSFKEDSQSASFSLSAIKERRRTASLTKRSESVWKFLHDDNSAMSWELDEVRTVAPYEPRTFPLSDCLFEEMLVEMPPDDPPSRSEEEANHVARPSSRSSSGKRETHLSESAGVVDRPPSTNSNSSQTAATLDESPSMHEEDINDPEFFPDEGKKLA